MGWEALVPLIVQYGLPLAEQLWQKWSSGNPPTQADWDSLKALALQTRRTQMSDALVRNGVDPTSDKGKALLALVM